MATVYKPKGLKSWYISYVWQGRQYRYKAGSSASGSLEKVSKTDSQQPRKES